MNLHFDSNVGTINADYLEVTDGTLANSPALQTWRTPPRNKVLTKSDTQMSGEISGPSAAEPSDRCLVRRIHANDQHAAAQIYHRYARRLMSLVTRQCSADLARYAGVEDIVQSVFWIFFRRISEGGYEIEAGGTAWKVLMIIAINRVRREATYCFAAKRDAHRTIGGELGRLSIESRVRESQPREADLVREEILEQLPSRHRLVVSLRIDGWPVAEIADKTGWSTRTVSRALTEARVRLSESLQKKKNRELFTDA